MEPSLITIGVLNSTLCKAYVEYILGPTLRERQIILIDNLSAHKRVALRALLAAHGCRLWYLPTYSPNFSPIELAIAKIKAALQRVGASTSQTLEATVAEALTHILPEEARVFFTPYGFRFCCDSVNGSALSYRCLCI
jgi:transposase